MFVMIAGLSITGLLLTEALMWVGVERFSFHYMVTKVVVTGIVIVYNFVTKKTFLKKGCSGRALFMVRIVSVPA